MTSLISVIGPTASGKTRFATLLAKELNGEIISADSRQVYRHMDIGTGKDLADYQVDGIRVPYHLIDIHPAGYKYNVFEYQHDFHIVYEDIVNRGKQPVLCGGTGLYVEAVLKGYKLMEVPENPELRKSLEDKKLAELTKILADYKKLHNKTDVDTVKRAIRAIEIEEYYNRLPVNESQFPAIDGLLIGIDINREKRREKISKRLFQRLQNGMIEEVDSLLKSGIAAEDLIYYGLEYKFITLYLTGKLTYEQMTSQLEIAIHQFAKRQMTWFRGMEKRGFKIHWLDADLPDQEKIAIVKEQIEQRNNIEQKTSRPNS